MRYNVFLYGAIVSMLSTFRSNIGKRAILGVPFFQRTPMHSFNGQFGRNLCVWPVHGAGPRQPAVLVRRSENRGRGGAEGSNGQSRQT